MKIYKPYELSIGSNYFFVFEGVVYYGECIGDKFDRDEPTAFEINDHNCDKFICDVVDAVLIYTLDDHTQNVTKKGNYNRVDAFLLDFVMPVLTVIIIVGLLRLFLGA